MSRQPTILEGPVLLRAGVDENGLGPQLGPLVVTGVLARCSPSGARYLERLDLAKQPRIDDSKKVASFGNTALAECWARALVPEAKTPDELVSSLSLADRGELRALCPAHVEPQCWAERGSFSAPDELFSLVCGDRDALSKKGVELHLARSVILCSERLHREREKGLSLLDIDLHAMERLLVRFRDEGSELTAICGKVGGIARYLERLGPLSGTLATIEEEGKARSSYRIAGLGRVSFVRDADGDDLLVALASLVGKYLREVLMGKIASHYLERDPSLPRASGYRDPVTDRFVLATAEARQASNVPARCFLRP